jgi:pimeloyl-ACP methyl ester carboxylesterase
MGVLIDRVSVISTCLTERFRRGLPEIVGPTDREAVFILDGVGGFQSVPLLIRKIFREQGAAIGTIACVWQFGVPGEIWTDLMWQHRNRVMGARLARKILAFRRTHPNTRIHLFGFSGGTGIAVFACESLRGRRVIDTMVLAAPALSPDYNLSRAMSAVTRCYALTSRRDRIVLGAGTRVFGTIDRRFTSAAGRHGFRMPAALNAEDRAAYDRLVQFRWSDAWRDSGHHGGHTGPVTAAFLARHLVALLRGAPGPPLAPRA